MDHNFQNPTRYDPVRYQKPGHPEAGLGAEPSRSFPPPIGTHNSVVGSDRHQEPSHSRPTQGKASILAASGEGACGSIGPTPIIFSQTDRPHILQQEQFVGSGALFGDGSFHNTGGLDGIFRRVETDTSMGRGGTTTVVNHSHATHTHATHGISVQSQHLVRSATSPSQTRKTHFVSVPERERRDPSNSSKGATSFLPHIQTHNTNKEDETTLQVIQRRASPPLVSDDESSEVNLPESSRPQIEGGSNLMPEEDVEGTDGVGEQSFVPRRNLMTAFENFVEVATDRDVVHDSRTSEGRDEAAADLSVTATPQAVLSSKGSDIKNDKIGINPSPSDVRDVGVVEGQNQQTPRETSTEHEVGNKGNHQVPAISTNSMEEKEQEAGDGPWKSNTRHVQPVVDAMGKGVSTRREPQMIPSTPTVATNNEWEEEPNGKMILPKFNLHRDLKRELPQPLIDRVSFYGVIHDINKEAQGMASHDHSAFARNNTSTEQDNNAPPKDENMCPLVVAVNGPPNLDDAAVKSECVKPGGSMVLSAIVDEERWLLSAIASRSKDEIAERACPPSFAEAIGEQEAGEGEEGRTNNNGHSGQTANPLSALASSRTQLWKPSRSWWEAKSGKNPWIEPNSHNKRWRYLWPLIHYHKFLARCIKKLKRNGVDVKTSLSPVSAFLREEVCAVSDHLAAVSKFTADEWMSSLVHFHGWTEDEPEAEAELRQLVSKQKLRSLAEPSDVHSPLLRDQIDEQFLRAMAANREQMANGGLEARGNKVSNRDMATLNHVDGNRAMLQKAPYSGQSLPSVDAGGMYPNYHPNDYGAAYGHGPPAPPYAPPGYPSPYDKARQRLNRKGGNLGSKQALRQRRGQYNRNKNIVRGSDGWLQAPQPYGDPSVPLYPPHTYGYPHSGFAPYDATGNIPYYPPHDAPHPTNQQSAHVSGFYHNVYHEQGAYPMPNSYHVEPHTGHVGWTPDVGQAYGGLAPHHNVMYPPPSPGSSVATASGVPGTPEHPSVHPPPLPEDIGQGPYESAVPPSPFWGHVEQATMAVTGLGTPRGGHGSPGTPERNVQMKDKLGEDEEGGDDKKIKGDGKSDPKRSEDVAKTAKPLLINPNHRQFGTRGGYAPPSPATQFLMSPQASSQAAAYFAHSQHQMHGFSMPPSTSRQVVSSPEAVQEQLPSIPDNATAETSTTKKDSAGNTEQAVNVTPPPSVVRTKAVEGTAMPTKNVKAENSDG